MLFRRLPILGVVSNVITLPERVIRRIREEAHKLGMTYEEYLVELITQGLNPHDKAVEYIETALELLNKAREELRRGDVRQAAEKLWGATALAVKAYAWWKEGRRLTSHGELWEYSKRIMEELGAWVSDSWAQATAMHVCFYEGWCTARHVEEAIKRIEKLLNEVKARVVKC